MKSILAFSLALCAGSVFAQDSPITYGSPECKVGKLLPPPADGTVRWQGKCKEAYAEGAGVLEWKTADGTAMRLQGNFKHGEAVGEAKLHVGDRLTYMGSITSGMPDGEGYLKFADGLQYEGGIKMMRREGKGTQIYVEGAVYQGQFHDNRPNGTGRMSFALGGSIEGEFQDGRPVGPMKIVYAGSGRTGEWTPKEKESSGGAKERYQLRSDDPQIGSLLRHVDVTGPLPSNLGWDALTPAQREQFMSQYPGLEPGDEPPYPEHGPASIYKVVHAAASKYDGEGLLRMNVLVGADGIAKQVIRIGVFDDDVVRYAAQAAMAQHYKPASCHGAPCEMLYPLRIRFTHSL
jgi:hypothetical protein